MDKNLFQKIVLDAAKSTPRITNVAVTGFEVMVTYLSQSGKTKNNAYLLFDKEGNFLHSHNTFSSANTPKFLVDKILEGIKWVGK